jgi:hypothetical protein
MANFTGLMGDPIEATGPMENSMEEVFTRYE